MFILRPQRAAEAGVKNKIINTHKFTGSKNDIFETVTRIAIVASSTRSLVRDGQTSPHKPRLVVPHSTCPSLSPSPPAHNFIIGPAVINTHLHGCATNTEDTALGGLRKLFVVLFYGCLFTIDLPCKMPRKQN
jgi:hypothetical protein